MFPRPDFYASVVFLEPEGEDGEEEEEVLRELKGKKTNH